MDDPHARHRLTIHRLGADDLARVDDLLAVFAAAFEDPGTYRGRPAGGDYLRRVLSNPHVIVLAALAGAEVAGGIVAYVLPKIEQARSEVYLYDLAVAPPLQRRGVATALIEGLRSVAAEIGAHVVFVQAVHGDDPAIALYSGLGTRTDVFHFDIAVPAVRTG